MAFGDDDPRIGMTKGEQDDTGEYNRPTPPPPGGSGTPPAPPPTEPEPGDLPPETSPGPPAPPRPPLPGPSTETPLAAGSFALPGENGGANPFRTLDFLRNRFISGGRDVGGPLGLAPGGAEIAGGLGLSPGAGGEPDQLPEDELRRLYAGILGGGGRRF
jgi:hypothetical protein